MSGFSNFSLGRSHRRCRGNRARSATSIRPALECLEDRLVPSGTPVGSRDIVLKQIVTIDGWAKTDILNISMEDGQLKVVHERPTSPIEPPWKEIKYFDPLSIAHFVYQDHPFPGIIAGDSVTNDTSFRLFALGGPGLDIFKGGSGDDEFHGGAGDDALDGRGGNDRLFGDIGNEILIGGAGNDKLYGHQGNDSLEGQAGDDILNGSTGNDVYIFRGQGLGSDQVIEPIVAGADNLDLSGLADGATVNIGSHYVQQVTPTLRLRFSSILGIDHVTGSPQADVIRGNAFINVIYGQGGDDKLYGLGSKDQLNGGAGNDLLDGGDADDSLNGYTGNDTLHGRAGNDLLLGGTGDDQLYGEEGNDSIRGESGNDRLLGGSGNDQLRADAGTDYLFGSTGNDLLDGGAGNDSMLGGGGGYDQVFASQALETVSGNESIRLAIVGGSPQTDGWSCGPNSGSRFLKAYGIDVSYDQLRSEVQDEDIIPDMGLGTPPPVLQEVLQAHKADVQLESNASFQKVLDLLAQCKPVIALMGWGEVVLGPAGTGPETLHYRVFSGFDLASQTLYYTETDGDSESMSFAQFQDQWDWPAWGPTDAALAALGVEQNTILY